ncbi:hypothetical protein M5C72_01800 [Companilactobacillus allii]|nr:hypothetical protein [Companilactobacillus allii]USQ68992.1 hypothetical protein M5C72_01800 [Companilactobacillus allii]
MEKYKMDRKEVIQTIEESVGEFNMLSESNLIGIVMQYLDRFEDSDFEPTLLDFRRDLIEYDEKTGHVNERDVDELVFKINQSFNGFNTY